METVLSSAISITHEPDPRAWDAFVEAHPDATGYHLWAWRSVFTDAMGHRAVYLAALRNGQIAGVLPLVLFHTWVFGRFAVSLPFLNYGGVVSSDQDVAEALLAEAVRVAEAHRCGYLEIRHLDQRYTQLTPKRHKVGMYLTLAETETTQWEHLDRKVRNQIRKAQKSEFTTARGGLDLLDEYYDVFARNMRDLGTPVYSKRFFADVLRAVPARAHLHVVRDKQTPIAASLTFGWRDMVEVPWASSLKEYRSQNPNMLLYWEMLRTAVADGMRVFDFGRSTPDEGTFHFKRQWGAEPKPMCWEYWLPDGKTLPDHSPDNPKFAAAVATWQKLPLPIANWLGPQVVRGIP